MTLLSMDLPPPEPDTREVTMQQTTPEIEPRAVVEGRTRLQWGWERTALLVSGLLFLGILLAVTTGTTQSTDIRVEKDIHHVLGTNTFGIFRYITFFGSGLAAASVLVPVIALLLMRKRHYLALATVLAPLGGNALVEVAKETVRRARPQLFPSALHVNSYSFPSGHATNSLVFFALLAYLISISAKSRWLQTMSVILAALAVIAIGLSRIVLGVHYPSDVLGGYALGAAWLSLVFIVMKRWVTK